MKKLIVALSAVVLSACGLALHAAGDPAVTPASHAGHMGAAHATGNAATQAFKQANAAMHKDMDIEFTGDADVDYMRGMIAHHQGAIDMSNVVLAHGQDAQVRALAKNVIKDQTAEIDQIKAWLSKRGQ